LGWRIPVFNCWRVLGVFRNEGMYMTFGELIVSTLERSCQGIEEAIEILKRPEERHLLEYSIEDLMIEIEFIKHDINVIKKMEESGVVNNDGSLI